MQTSQFYWTDTHCHLYVEEFGNDRTAMIQRALDQKISIMMMPNIDEASIAPMEKLSELFPGSCFPMMGLHPCSVREDWAQVLDRMELLLKGGTYFGVGETGIDLYWDTTFADQQVLAFERQIGWAKACQLPIIIHSRSSLELTISLIEKHQDGRLKGIFHCFSGTPEDVSRIEAVGFKVGIGGVLTYKNSRLEQLLPSIPLKMIVLETDSPYLAPVPHRGKRNEPAYLAVIARRMAQILQLDEHVLAEITNANATEVYGKIN